MAQFANGCRFQGETRGSLDHVLLLPVTGKNRMNRSTSFGYGAVFVDESGAFSVPVVVGSIPDTASPLLERIQPCDEANSVRSRWDRFVNGACPMMGQLALYNESAAGLMVPEETLIEQLADESNEQRIYLNLSGQLLEHAITTGSNTRVTNYGR